MSNNKRRQRTEGASVKVYKVKNNFEEYVTTEYPSQAYQNAYVSECIVHHGMRLSEIKFEFTQHTVFITNRRVGSYGSSNYKAADVSVCS